MKPRHKKSKYYADKGLFSDISSFEKFEQKIMSSPEEKRGEIFEVFAEAYFATQKLSQASEIWPTAQVPFTVQALLGLSTQDMGIDGIILTASGDYNAYQAKFRSHRTPLSWDELSTFMGLSDRVSKRILFSNSVDLPPLMKDRTDFYAVKGNDLDKLQKADFLAIEEWLKCGAFSSRKKTPFEYQEEAISNILSELEAQSRTTTVMACGTGKTLISLWVAERVKPESVLILSPSLSLVRQTLHEWMKETSWKNPPFMCVCSDQTVSKGIDEIIIQQSDLDFPVTLQAGDVEKFLKLKASQPKLIFSTYHSSKIVAQGMPKGFAFDFAIFDEAHKTASRKETTFSCALNNSNLPIRKRIFATATPRHYDVEKKNKEGDPRLVFSMDDEDIYGKVSHRLSFASAAQKGIISRYKIIISVVTSEMVTKELLKRGEVVVDGDIVKAQRVANILAVKDAIEKNNVRKVFTFHTSVQSAKEFASNSAAGIQPYLENFQTFHVNGGMPTSGRELIMKEFEQTPKSLMSNARCLTEGIDVPVVDMVVFISPKRSHVDIVQAVGRAMRKAPGKQVGYVLLPVFLEVAKNESIEETLKTTRFEEVWHVLEAMQEQDEELADIIRQMREAIARRGAFDDTQLRERVEIIGPELRLSTLRNIITTKIVENLGSPWDERFGALMRFKEKTGHCNVSSYYPENHVLGIWLEGQRRKYREGKLHQKRVEKLETIGVVWDPLSSKWEEMFAALCKYKEKTGHCNVPARFPEDPVLSTWVSTQREQYKSGTLLKQRERRLQEIGFEWNPFDVRWEEVFFQLCRFKERMGHCNVAAHDPENKLLGIWLARQRNLFREGKLHPKRQEKLETIGVVWDPLSLEKKNARWEFYYGLWVKVAQEQGHCRLNKYYEITVDGKLIKLGSWYNDQKKNFASLSLEKQERLQKLPGFIPKKFCRNKSLSIDEWIDLFISVSKRLGTPLIPKTHSEDGFKLGQWMEHIRKEAEWQQLTSEQRQRLLDNNFKLFPTKERDEAVVLAMSQFALREGKTIPKTGHAEEILHKGVRYSIRLDNLCNKVKMTPHEVKPAILEGLKRIPNFFEELMAQKMAKNTRKKDSVTVKSPSIRVKKDGKEYLQKGLGYFEKLKERTGKISIIPGHLEEGFDLSRWMRKVRTRKKLDESFKSKILAIDPHFFSENTLRIFVHEIQPRIEQFMQENGHALIPQGYVCADGYLLGEKVSDLRERRATLLQPIITYLDSLGDKWAWNYFEYFHLKRAQELIKYLESSNFPKHPLPKAIRILKSKVKKALPQYPALEQYRKRIEELAPGFFNEPKDENYLALLRYVAREGHACPPIKHIEDGKKIGLLVSNTRQKIKKGRASIEERAKYEGLPGWREDASDLQSSIIRETSRVARN
jgi:superfamily II DNA or RNA helicase